MMATDHTRKRRVDVHHVARPMTARQRLVLETLHRLTVSKGYPPTVRELSAALGMTGRGAGDHLFALECRGMIERGPLDQARNARLTETGRLEVGAGAQTVTLGTRGRVVPIATCLACGWAFVAGTACFGCKLGEAAA